MTSTLSAAPLPMVTVTVSAALAPGANVGSVPAETAHADAPVATVKVSVTVPVLVTSSV
ncbi:MAG: hypothetical protein R3E31_28355 [Chloroflexota bacterium]